MNGVILQSDTFTIGNVWSYIHLRASVQLGIASYTNTPVS